ncbi:hypothetical protein HMPREF0044_0497 [Gleimia coleocanis DSM 15436]|uniref:Uncharacterized protein n=1 Tax=Gleimia coleocanis DSM 15436 TaxID=525245 RepID=C0VZA7_9ACTO|nr:hypothetical protein HMPREF0044_0497 [Gleimia coleocanis DSM 15436]
MLCSPLLFRWETQFARILMLYNLPIFKAFSYESVCAFLVYLAT